MKNLLRMSDLSPAELTHILDVADQLKAQQKLGGTAPLLAGKSVALLFSKASTRTRTSFEVGVYQLGGLGNYMNTAELQAGRGEPLKDTARVLGRYYDCVVWRTYRQSDLEEFAELAGVPVINGLTDYAHPCQVLADLMTIRERRGSLAGRKLCFVGDGSSMANSLIVGGLLAGMQVTCVCPQSYRPAADVLMFAHKYGSAFHLTADPAEGIQDADVVATAVWNTAKPGTPESEQRLRDFVGFQLTGKLLEAAKRQGYIYRDQTLPVVLYPKEYEITWVDKKGTSLFFRPVKATDERAIQELIYDLPPQDVYTRFFHNLKSFSHKVAMPMAAIDYDDKMAIVAVIGKEEPEGREKIVAIGNYANNPNTRYAEVAFTTHQDWQDRGIGTFLLQYLIRIAKEKNIEGFTADVLSRNRAMMQVFSKCGCPMTTHLDTGVYELKINFGAEEKKE